MSVALHCLQTLELTVTFAWYFGLDQHEQWIAVNGTDIYQLKAATDQYLQLM